MQANISAIKIKYMYIYITVSVGKYITIENINRKKLSIVHL